MYFASANDHYDYNDYNDDGAQSTLRQFKNVL